MASRKSASSRGQRASHPERSSSAGLSPAISLRPSAYYAELERLSRRQRQEVFQRSFLRQTVKEKAQLQKNNQKSLVQDKRRFHPLGKLQYPLTTSGKYGRITIKDPLTKAYNKFSAQTKGVQAFANPNHLIICIRRKIRKQIMFALNLRKKGGRGGSRKRRYNEFSTVRC